MGMAIVKEYIKITPELRKELTERYHITRQALWKILSNQSNSARAKEIRRYTEAHGGQLIVMISVNRQNVSIENDSAESASQK